MVCKREQDTAGDAVSAGGGQGMNRDPCPSPRQALAPNGSELGSGTPTQPWVFFGGNQGLDALPKA